LTTAVPADGSRPELAERLGHRFHDPVLLERAMAHRSWCAEHPGHPSNERLEFLGDAVLGWVTADLAFRRFPALSEGDLTGIRKGVVNTTALAEIAGDLGLGAHIKLGKGEAAAGGSAKPTILADALEAVIGAVYVDGGSTEAYDVVQRLVGDRVMATAERLDELDYKSTLQEILAGAGRLAPRYEIEGVGPDHEKRYTAHVVVDGVVRGRGDGRSKRTAEQAAAAAAVATLAAEPDA